PADVTELPLDAGRLTGGGMPKGALQTRTDLGITGYVGPCPPEGHGPHRYVFTIHAVNVETLPVTEDTSPAVVGFNLHFATLGKATLVGLYKR
ncbi:MAG TPA: YbhB/YbcL family Raf kinase inhibitor-like protein, partial [Chloroflexota bacterium]|nr:YbhB/YbcL family Raf kinase inhibitor-like protein [Chloroflexota bacterium]